RGPVCVRPRRAVAPESCERIAADLLLVDHADIRTRGDFRLDLFFLDRCAGMRSAIWKRHALAPLGPHPLLSEPPRAPHHPPKSCQASLSSLLLPPPRVPLGRPRAVGCLGLSSHHDIMNWCEALSRPLCAEKPQPHWPASNDRPAHPHRAESRPG